MPAVATTPPLTIQSQFPSVFYDDPVHRDPLSGTSYSSSPEVRPVDPHSPIPEEEEDETSSETAEPLTPTDHLQQAFADKMNGTTNDLHTQGAIRSQQPLMVNTQTPIIFSTAATPPPPSAGNDATPTQTPLSGARSPKLPMPRRQGSNSADTTRRTFSGFFKRSNSQSGPGSFLEIRPDMVANGSEPTLLRDQQRRISTSASSTRSNTPPSPGSPVESTLRHAPQQLQVQEPSPEDMFQKKKHRSATGLSIRDKIKKISFPGHGAPIPKANEPERHRAASVDLEGSEIRGLAHENPDLRNLERSVFGISAETGIGLKSRRLSLSLPDDFMVETAELYSIYKDQSRIIGRRGKNVGTGATANVKLMLRKGTDEVYAVKEFRGKGTKEKTEEYEKKIKSEYSIAKSAHHPNIVETISLCTHNGRWNHVMEYCEAGDLFSLVQQKYLSKVGHEKDRLCLFKQLIQGLHYLHGHGIAHRDIKLENILITKDSKLKISDFGVSEIFCGIHPGLRSAGGQCGRGMEEVRLCTPGISGSKPYLSPEVLAEKG
jgi:protein-serine/threonine kinase